MEVNIGLIGFGTIGTGVVKLLKENSGLIEKKTGVKLVLKRIADKDITSNRGVDIEPGVLTTDTGKIFSDPEIKIVIELIGGEEPARSFIIKALSSGKHVVTANKLVLAKYGGELHKLARENNVRLEYEASVAGGIPFINALKEGFVANKITRITGIINGTTNYILTKMEEGLSFEQALDEAKLKGFAEADPGFDIDGIDALQKLVIISHLAFGSKILMEEIYTEGISKITLEDINCARKFGYNIKLLAVAVNLNGELELRVHPALLPLKHPLASVRNENNAIYIEGDAFGAAMFYGKGAGQLPTASSVVSDAVRIAASLEGSHQAPGLFWGDRKLKPTGESVSRYYLRFPVIDQPGIVGKIGAILGKHGISITSIIASLAGNQGNEGNVEAVTHLVKEKNILASLQEVEKLSITRGPSVLIKIEE